jgi:hypothetical protein
MSHEQGRAGGIAGSDWEQVMREVNDHGFANAGEQSDGPANTVYPGWMPYYDGDPDFGTRPVTDTPVASFTAYPANTIRYHEVPLMLRGVVEL